MDFFGPLITTANKNAHLVTAIDYGTNWAYTKPLIAKSASAAISLLKEIILNHGVPTEIITKNESEFLAREFRDYLKTPEVKHITTMPYHPQSNGLVERIHGTLLNTLRKFSSPYNQNLWDEYINICLFAYRVPLAINKSLAVPHGLWEQGTPTKRPGPH